ncbi:MAG: aldehyde dehydrogenase family protein [Chthoniobacteraceae bacterium]|jgi:glyceraldehyde-3-phosphate dehydrogenase (NADP+)
METVVNPYNGEVVGHYAPADLARVREAIDAGHAAFAKTRKEPGIDRSAVLLRVSQLIEKRSRNLAQLITAEAGKPLLASLLETTRAVYTFRFAAQEATQDFGAEIDFDASVMGQGHTGVATRVPIGLILGISPFNFPLNLVATGNTMLLKPSPRTPLTALALGDILNEAGMPENQVRVLPFDHQFIPTLLKDERVKMLTFTGSAPVGWELKRLAVKQKVTLELGGNAAVIVHSDADWAAAAPMIAAGAFGYAGQSCISVQRILVHTAIYDEFREAFVRHTETNIPTGDPADVATVNGPMIDAAARDRVLEWTREAMERGATSALPLRHEGNCVWPIILENVPGDARIVCEEAFGPVAVLSRYEDFDAALAEVNASRYGLQAGVFTGASELAKRAFDVIEAGGVLINQTPTFRVENMPYGGIKDSGFGREGVRYAMEEMTEWKTFIMRRAAE